MTDSHTPGPWKAIAGNGELDLKARFPTDARVLIIAPEDCDTHPIADCSCNHTCRMDWDCEANARLIAAAPDLLAACQEFVRKVEAGEARSTRSYQQMKAAISKATGEKSATAADCPV